MQGVIQFFQAGGKFMVLNIFMVAFALAVIVERTYSLFMSYGINDKPFVAAVDRYLQAGNIEAAAKVCSQSPSPALSRATRNLLKLFRNGMESPMLAVEESLMEVKPLVMARVGWLWAIANIATLIGLVGTVNGLIGTFAAIGPLPAEEKAQKLSEGISEAMNNTLFGLSIAVFCIFAHLVLNNQVVKIVEKTEHALFHFVNVHAQYRSGFRPAEGEQKKA